MPLTGEVKSKYCGTFIQLWRRKRQRTWRATGKPLVIGRALPYDTIFPKYLRKFEGMPYCFATFKLP